MSPPFLLIGCSVVSSRSRTTTLGAAFCSLLLHVTTDPGSVTFTGAGGFLSCSLAVVGAKRLKDLEFDGEGVRGLSLLEFGCCSVLIAAGIENLLLSTSCLDDSGSVPILGKCREFWIPFNSCGCVCMCGHRPWRSHVGVRGSQVTKAY